MDRNLLKELWELTGEIGCHAETKQDDFANEVYILLMPAIDLLATNTDLMDLILKDLDFPT